MAAREVHTRGERRAQRASERSARAVAAGRKTLKEHQAFVEAVLAGDLPLGTRWDWTGARAVVTGAFLAAGIGIGAGLGQLIGLGGASPRPNAAGPPSAVPAPAAKRPGTAIPAAPPAAVASRVPEDAVIAQRLLPGAITKAREEWINRNLTTPFERAHKNQVQDAYCTLRRGNAHRDAFRCAIGEKIPPDSANSINFDVKLERNGCWDAVVANNADPTGTAELRGCL